MWYFTGKKYFSSYDGFLPGILKNHLVADLRRFALIFFLSLSYTNLLNSGFIPKFNNKPYKNF